jgi:hypothetical protein
MQKISKTRIADHRRFTSEEETLDTRPRCIPGATITSWHGSLDVDLSALFAKPRNGATVAGAGSAESPHTERDTVSLSDGTQITFATAGRFKSGTLV